MDFDEQNIVTGKVGDEHIVIRTGTGVPPGYRVKAPQNINVVLASRDTERIPVRNSIGRICARTGKLIWTVVDRTVNPEFSPDARSFYKVVGEFDSRYVGKDTMVEVLVQ